MTSPNIRAPGNRGRAGGIVMHIEFRNGEATIFGHLERAAESGRAPAIVLIPDVRGLSDHFRDIARRFRRAGFSTLVLDPYSREGAPDLPDMDAVFARLATLPDRRVLGDVHAAIAYLADRDDVDSSRIGVTGFCMGGQYALMAACCVPGIAAAVSWYGMLRYDATNETKPESALDVAPRLACPYLGFFGAEDALIDNDDVERLREIVAMRDVETEIRLYPGAGHAFFNDTRADGYRPEAAADSWERAVRFFAKHLRR